MLNEKETLKKWGERKKMDTNLKLVTYNIRHVWDGDGTNSLFCRLGLMLDKILEQRPDIICFQEAREKNMSLIEKCLATEYAVLFNQRASGYTGEGLAIAFKRERISLYGLEIFWLSETPYIVDSRFEGQSEHSRICQRLLFKDEYTGKVFRIYNLHLDHINEEVRYLQIQVVMKRVVEDKKQYDLPFFMLGDFNATPEEKAIRYCLDNQDIDVCDLTSEISGSFHNFGRQNPEIKIDYIITDHATADQTYTVEAWKDSVNGVYLSDHYPIALDIKL